MASSKKSTTLTKGAPIPLSHRASFYFFMYFWWVAFKKLILWTLIAVVAITAIGLIRNTQIFGMSDQDIARAFIRPLPHAFATLVIIISVYSLVRSIISSRTTKYIFSAKSVIIQSGWPTRRTTIVDYTQIQKMTIVSNPLDRALQATYVQLDLVGGAPGVLLEAVDDRAIKDIQKKLSLSNTALLTASSQTTTKAKPTKTRKTSKSSVRKKTLAKKKATKKK